MRPSFITNSIIPSQNWIFLLWILDLLHLKRSFRPHQMRFRIFRPKIPRLSNHSNFVSEKTFLKARNMAGQVDFKANKLELEDYKWLSNEELQQQVDPQVPKTVLPLSKVAALSSNVTRVAVSCNCRKGCETRRYPYYKNEEKCT